MLPDVKKYDRITQYTDEEFIAASNRILKHKQSVLKFQSSLSSASGAILDGDYTLGRISHNYFSDCTFQNASLKSVAGAGSIFSYVDFYNTDISHAGFHSSTIEHCKFKDCNMESSNMSKCYIADTDWIKCRMQSMNLSASHLRNCTISHCISNPGNLSECCFDNVHIEGIRLTNLNLEFSHFKKITTKNVILPFSQMPYIFGGLFYLMTTKDSVRISSHINDENSISVEEYKQVLRDMEIFYSYKQEYFPLANILLAFGQSKEALSAILLGITSCATLGDFRMCKYFCKLITEYGNCNSEQHKMLYDALMEKAPVNNLSEAQYYQYNCYIPEIRSMLIENPRHYPHGILTIWTDIDDIESEKIPVLLECLDSFLHLDYCTLEQPSISIRHNSPVVAAINLCGNPLTILVVTALLLKVTVGICKGYNEIAQAIISTQTIKKNRSEERKNQLEERKLSAEIRRLELENTDLQDRLSKKQQQITDSGIVIMHTEMIGNDFNPYQWL